MSTTDKRTPNKPQKGGTPEEPAKANRPTELNDEDLQPVTGGLRARADEPTPPVCVSRL